MIPVNPLWQPNTLLGCIPELNWQQPSATPNLNQALADYRQFYGLPRPDACHWASHQIGYEAISGYPIAVQQWQHTHPVGNLILVHGYYDHLGLYGSVIRFCEQQQLNLLAFDLPGHGLSGGPQAEIGDFDEYVRIFDHLFHQGKQQNPGIWYALGQSTGGAILASWLLSKRPTPGDDGPGSVALLAPLLKPVGWGLGRWLTPCIAPFRKRLKRHFRHDGNTPAFSQFLEQSDPLQPHYLSVRWVQALARWIPKLEAHSPLVYPVFLVQGEQDKTVEWRYNVAAYQRRFPDLMTHIMPDAHHHLVNDIAIHQTEMYQWLAHRFVIR